MLGHRCGANSLPLSLIICSHLLAASSAVLASKAEGTICTYLAGLKRWKLWALCNCFRHMPVNSFHVAAYLQSLSFEANSPSPVLNAVYSINWAQRLAGLPKNRPGQTNFVICSLVFIRGRRLRNLYHCFTLFFKFSHCPIPQFAPVAFP